MTTRVTRVDIDAVAPQRWRIGLMESSGAQRLPDNAISRLAGGIGYETFDPSFNPDVGTTFDPCADFTVAEGEGVVRQWNTWGIAIGEECSTLNAADGTIEAMEERARARLDAQTSYLAEYTFWTGLVGGTQFDAIAPTAWPNIALTNHDAITDLTPVDGEAGVVEAFGLINEYLSDTLRGLRGVIHVAPQLLPSLLIYRRCEHEPGDCVPDDPSHIGYWGLVGEDHFRDRRVSNVACDPGTDMRDPKTCSAT